jgi:hypothetical protein
MTDIQEINLDGNKLLCFPYKLSSMKEEYENYKSDEKIDFVITHITPPECAFADEGIQLNIDCKKYIHGHTHERTRFKDKYNREHFVIGVPLPTRNGEKCNSILKINDDKSIEEIEVPEFLKIENIEYGNLPENKDWIYNIKNAPSFQSVNDMYKDYYIRKEGITIKREESEIEFEISEKENKSLQEEFKVYSVEKGLSKEVINCCYDYLGKREIKNE